MTGLRSESKAENSAMFRSSIETRDAAKRSFPWLLTKRFVIMIARCNGRLKDEFGGRCVQVSGADKVMMHLMFGIIALFADQLLKVTGC